MLPCSFKEAEKVLELEMKEAVPQQELLLQHWLGPGRGGAALAGESDGVVEGLLFATAGGGDPAELVLAFDRLAAWVDRSLDLYRPELSRVLFPAFAHTYLNLLRLEATAEAQQLMGAHRQRFLDAAVGGSSLRMQVGGRMGGCWGAGRALLHGPGPER
jgi:transcription initiation factor TFIID subunit 5